MKSAELIGISDYKLTHLHLHFVDLMLTELHFITDWSVILFAVTLQQLRWERGAKSQEH